MGGFLAILLGTLGASKLENMLTGKGIMKAGYSSKYDESKDFPFKKGKGIIRAGNGSKGSSINDFYQKIF